MAAVWSWWFVYGCKHGFGSLCMPAGVDLVVCAPCRCGLGGLCMAASMDLVVCARLQVWIWWFVHGCRCGSGGLRMAASMDLAVCALLQSWIWWLARGCKYGFGSPGGDPRAVAILKARSGIRGAAGTDWEALGGASWGIPVRFTGYSGGLQFKHDD